MAADRKSTISGPGASDFLTSPGGEDRPGTSPSKGTSQTRDQSNITDPRNLEPALAPEKDAGNDQPDRRTGSQTGTVGGGGADAHNPDPVRATGTDNRAAEPSAEPAQKKRTTKKY